MFGGEVCGQGEGSELKTVQIQNNISRYVPYKQERPDYAKKKTISRYCPFNEAPAASQTTFIIGQLNFACVMVHKNKPLWRSS
jgi:hypothetical protein